MSKGNRPKIVVPILEMHKGQQAVLDSIARFKVVVCGRRWGKTELGKRIVAQQLETGMATVWWIAPTYQMAGQVWRDLKRTFRQREDVTINESERRLDFDQGGVLAIRSAHTPDNLRGAGLNYAVLDEAAFMAPDVWSEIIQPMLLDKKGHALLISTPNSKNWFWELYQLGLQGKAEWQSFHYPSEKNEYLDKEALTNIRSTITDRVWRQEYLAEFLDDSGQVFRGIRDAATATETTPDQVRHTVAGVDWGREGDYTVIVVLDADTNTMLAMDRFNQIGWDFQRGRLKAMCERWNVETIYAEANSIGSVNIEALEREGLPVLPFQTTAKSKPNLIEALALAIETREICLLPDDILLRELAAYTMRRSTSGQWQYSAPTGSHDDCVIALALAWYALNTPRVRLEFA